MRDITKVIDAVLPTLREHAPRAAQRLESIREKACYTPPELMVERWVDLAWILTAELPAPAEGVPTWAKHVSDIVEDRVSIGT